MYPIARNVDYVDRVVARVRDVEPIRGCMNIRVIKSTAGSMSGQSDVTK